MVTLKELKEIIILKESGVDDQIIANVFNIKTESVKKYFLKGKKVIERTMDEADDAAGATGGGGSPGTTTPSQGTVKKWESGITRGHSNPVDQSHKYEFGTTHGHANPV